MSPSVVWRTLRVKGGNRPNLQVKAVTEHQIYVVAVARFNLKDGKETFHIREGAILVRNAELDVGDEKFFMIFNDGIFDAIRSQGAHVPDGMDREEDAVRATQGTIEWATRHGWTLVAATSPPEEYARRDAAVAGAAASLERCRDPDKVDACVEAARGASHTDRRGRVNLAAREGFLWSARRSLDARIRTHRRILPRVNARYWKLVELADSAWSVKQSFEAAVVEAHERTKPGRRLSTQQANALARDLRKLAERMRSVSLAPYGRRGFPQIAKDLDVAAKALQDRHGPDAHAALDACRRAFKMMDARRKGEEMYTVASRAEKAKAVPAERDVAALEADLDALEAMLREDGKPLDRGFRNPLIESKVLPAIRAARAAARAEGGYDAKGVCAGLHEANAPL